MAFPFFLCAVCCVIGMGQMMLVQTELQHSLSQTAKICAKEMAGETVARQIKQTGSEEGTDGYKGGYPGARKVFLSVYDAGSLCESVIRGGKSGIRITLSMAGEDELAVRADYVLKMPVPFFGNLRFSDSMSVSHRIFSGYVEQEGESAKENGNRIVYLAENGTVYHTNPECSHICLKISGSSAIKKIMDGSAYDACEKCIEDGGTPGQIYITAHGDCYHSSLSCSGLKRTIQAVRMSEVSGMRLCSRCALAK